MTKIHRSPKSEECKSTVEDLVIQLGVQRGEFWDEVSRIRDENCIVVRTDVPLSLSERLGQGFDVETGSMRKDAGTFASSTNESVGTIRLSDLESMIETFVPVRTRDVMRWSRFMENCLRFDPPKDKIMEYALACAPRVRRNVHEITNRRGQTTIIEHPQIAEVPVDVDSSFYEEIIERLVDDTQETRPTVEEILREDPELMQRFVYGSLAPQLLRRWVIEVDDDTTYVHVTDALRVIRTKVESSLRRGRPDLEPLTCVQCFLWAENGLSQREIAKRLDEDSTKESRALVKRRIDRGREIVHRTV